MVLKSFYYAFTGFDFFWVSCNEHTIEAFECYGFIVIETQVLWVYWTKNDASFYFSILILEFLIIDLIYQDLNIIAMLDISLLKVLLPESLAEAVH